MRPSRACVGLVAAAAVCIAPGLVRAAKHPDLSGHWALSPTRSQFPDDLGFNAAWATAATQSASSNSGRTRGGGGGRGSGGGSSGIGLTLLPSGAEGDQTFKIVDDLEAEAKHPPVSLAIAQADAAITFTMPDGGVRTFHTDQKQDIQNLPDAPVVTHATWDHAVLQISYVVEKGRSVQYRYERLSDGSLQVDLRFIESGGDKTPITRVYTKGD